MLRRIAVDIQAKVAQILITQNMICLVASFKQCAAAIKLFVIGFGITVKDTLQQQPRGRFILLTYEEVIVIGE